MRSPILRYAMVENCYFCGVHSFSGVIKTQLVQSSAQSAGLFLEKAQTIKKHIEEIS